MQINQTSVAESIPSASIQGDPATRTFGLFLIGALTMITFGAIAGIAAGNIAHYAYFPPYNTTNITNTSNDTSGNGTSYQRYIPRQSLRLWLPSNKQLENADTSRK